jgi:adenylosuccinate synthase
VGWLDGVLLRYAARVNGLTELTVTKLDIMSGIDPLRICTGYRKDGEPLATLPLGPSDLSPFEPIYETLPGWEQDIQQIRSWEELPARARDYIQRIEGLVNLPVRMISVGPERNQIIRR